MSQNSVPRSLVDLTKGAITSTVWIDAPRERVYAALTSAEVTQWWGSSSTYRTTGWSATVAAGGPWRAEGKGADGSEFSVSGTFKEVTPPHKLVLTWGQDWDETPPTLVTYVLDTIDGGTRLTVHHTGFGDHTTSCESHAAGWEGVLGWLRDHVERHPIPVV